MMHEKILLQKLYNERYFLSKSSNEHHLLFDNLEIEKPIPIPIILLNEMFHKSLLKYHNSNYKLTREGKRKAIIYIIDDLMDELLKLL